MKFDLTSRRWAWIILVCGMTCIYLGLALISHLETLRRQAELKIKAVEDLSHLVAAAHPLLDRRGLNEEDAGAFARQFRAKAAQLVRAVPGNPDVARLAAMADEVANVAEERRRAEIEKRPGPSSDAIRAWLTEYVKVQSGLANALPAPIAEIRHAVMAGVGVCFAGMLILFATRRAYRRQLETRLRAQLALRASEEKFRGLFEHVLEGVYQTSPGGGIIAANPALVSMLGLDSVQDLRRVDVGRDFYADPLERERLTRKLEQDGFLRNEELRLRRRDGAEITVLENARIARDSATGAVYYEGSLIDISDRKRAERDAAEYTRQLQEAHRKLELQAGQLLEQSFELTEARDQAVQSSRLKSEFLGNLSHEVRTPMNSVVGMTQLLLETGLNAQQSESAETVRRSAQYLLKVFDEILDYSRIETGQIDLADAPFSLRAAVDQVVEQTAAHAESKGIEMTFLVAREVPDALSGDAARLRQILFHLVENAVKFTASGEVAVHVSLARDRPDEVLIRFEVEDTGIGIPPESFVRLFEPFYQVDASARRRNGGTGLGLPIAKALTERMGGQIGVESEPGQGSLVWFQVRLAKQAGCEVLTLETGALKGRRVLVVDDVASSRGVLVQLLSSWDMRVSAAGEPAAALDVLQVAAHNGEPFDFSLLDYDLPGLGGFGLAEAILDDPETARTQLLLMVPHSYRGWQDEPLLHGIEAVLSKPVRELHLLEVLTACVEAARQADLGRLQRHLNETGSGDQPGSSPSGLAPATDNARPWILIVEDNVVNQKVTVRLVDKMGCRSEIAANGEEALAALDRRKFTLILMDCQMPVMDGFAATAAIRRREGDSSRIPIIAMTANAMKGDRELCLNAGMDDYLSKPVSYEDLRTTVGKWIEWRSSLACAPSGHQAAPTALPALG